MFPTTVVSCYYPVECSKHSIEQYNEWVPNFLRYITSPIVMFSDGETFDWLCKIRQEAGLSDRFFPIRKPLADLEFSTPEWLDIWDKQHEMGLKKKYWREHSLQIVNRIWANKAFFVQEAIQKNPFDSKYFVWCDAGCWRNIHTAKTFGKDWPATSAIKPNRLTILNIEPITPYIQKLDAPDIQTLEDVVTKIPTSFCMSVGGTILSGDTVAWSIWTPLFRQTLECFIKNNLFAADDQAVITSCLLWMYKSIPSCAPLMIDDPVGKGFYVIRDGVRLDDRWYVLQILLSQEFSHAFS